MIVLKTAMIKTTLTLQERLSKTLNCYDKKLLEKVELAIINFNQLDLTKQYHIAFSGGKDSTALLAIFKLWKDLFKIDTSNFVVKFADTRLEEESLYQLIENIENTIKDINFQRVLPEHSYWYYQFVIGYPVPNWRARWCTLKLKVQPMKNGSFPITGRHFGESLERDKRLNSCSSGECGIDKIKQSYDPMIYFTNCDVWDLIFYADGTILYEGVFNQLKLTYNQSEDSKGSLRMGCFMCPVVGMGTIKNNNNQDGYNFRLILEKLRKARRIKSPRTKKNGAIYIEDRRAIWNELDKQKLLELGFITKQEIREINLLIQKDSYPKTYSQEWINQQHQITKNQSIYDDLPLFNL